MNKQKIREIIKFSLRKNIQNKWFVILNILIFLVIFTIINGSNILQLLEEKDVVSFDDEITIMYVDNLFLFGKLLETSFEDAENVEVVEIDENNFTKETIGKDIVIEIIYDEDEIIKAKITSNEGISSAIYDKIVKTLDLTRIGIFSMKYDVDIDEVEMLKEDVSVERVMLSVNGENYNKKETIKYVSTMITYLVSIFIFSKIANDIAQEKVSKSIEYVLTSVSEKEYLFAKIASNILLILLQILYIVIYYIIGKLVGITTVYLYYNNQGAFLPSVNQINIDIDLIKYIAVVVLYGLLTIVLMSMIQAALSSKTTSISEAGNSVMFLLITTIAIYLLTTVLINPYTNMTPWMYVLSCVPLVSNFFIPAILIIGQAKIWQLVLSFSILLISIPITFNICSKELKKGVLDYKSNKNNKRKSKKILSFVDEENIKIDKLNFRKYGFVVGTTLIVDFAIEILVSAIWDIIIPQTLIDKIGTENFDILGSIICSVAGLGIASLFAHLFIKKSKKEIKTDSEQIKKMFLISIFLIVGIQFLSTMVETLMGIEKDVTEIFLDYEGLDNWFTCILTIVSIAIVPALFEELLFRKSLIDLSSAYGEKFAVVFSSLIFGITHLNFSQMFFAFFMGLMFGTIYVKTGKLRYCMLFHFVNNAIVAIVQILLYNSFGFWAFIIDITIIAVSILGGIVFVNEIIRRKQSKEGFRILEGKLIPRNFKYILTDYSIIIFLIFTLAFFTATETILGLI